MAKTKVSSVHFFVHIWATIGYTTYTVALILYVIYTTYNTYYSNNFSNNLRKI